MKQNSIRIILILILIGINIGCDQGTKHVARAQLRGETPHYFLGGAFVLLYAENEGAFLGFGSALPPLVRTIIFRFLPIGFLLAFLFYVIRNSTMSFVESIFCACIIGGGIGNLLDRLRFDGVVSDFMNFGIGSMRTGILNMADLSITIGVFGLLIYYIVTHRSVFGGSHSQKKS